ncbi:hypothetical protein NQ318_008183 [Aromia moschata]|uniref:RNA polymerase II subunit B1 CTD phosphatase RPAP2 homolog n=1 Tax=Aromia moschata TaxID=1265417 RepID=A0AAV8YHL9_9CUCU|nr:hypothetical protein NQ318_008183 [Aromia moschata]
MQDSIEDYIRISKNATKETNTISKETQVTALRKKECDLRAMKIVEFSIEGKLRPEVFMRCLPFINQSYYQDIVEERAITKLCGYSLCGKKIPEMPKKQYFISMKSNKVYDITDRKNYCSNFCYKASLHIKQQIDNGPLWLLKARRGTEIPLLGIHRKWKMNGLPGEFIDQGIVKPAVEPTFASVSLFTEASLQDVMKSEKGGAKSKKGTKVLNKSKMKKRKWKTQNPEKKVLLRKLIKKNRNPLQKPVRLTKLLKKWKPRVKLKLALYAFVIQIQRKQKKKQTTKEVDAELLIRKVLKEWLTLESYIFIHGESKKDQQIKYMQICKRLQLQEMADEKFDSALIGDAKLKPLPDYKQLKEGNKDLTLKVKCFYSGILHEKEDSNFPTKANKSGEADDEEGPPAVLPLVDVGAQNALRRKVFLTSINKWMQQLLQTLRVTNFSSVLSDLQNFVRTFSLKADNIVFKPIVWNYMAVVLLHILSVRDKNIRDILEEKQSQAYIDLQLSPLPNKNKLVSDVMTVIQNIDMFLETYISSK